MEKEDAFYRRFRILSVPLASPLALSHLRAFAIRIQTYSGAIDG